MPSAKKVVGARGFEPPTPRSRTECSTRLSHAPTTEPAYSTPTPDAGEISLRPAADRQLPADREAGPARVTGRACKIRLDRDDDMCLTGKRHDFLADYEIGFDAIDGEIRDCPAHTLRIASATSSIGISFRRYPAAPALIAS